MSSTRLTTQSMVVVWDRPRAKPRTDIATIIGTMLWLSATTSRHVAATAVAMTVSRRFAIRRTKNGVAALANSAPLELMPSRIPTWDDVRPTTAPSRGRYTRSRSIPLLAEKLVIRAAGIPRLRSRCQTRSARPVRTVDV